MLLIRIISVAAITLVICMVLRKQSPEIAAAAAAAGGVLILLMIWEPLKLMLLQLEQVSRDSIMPEGYISLMIRAVTMAFTGEIAVSLCREAGEPNLGQKVEMACHIFLLSLSVPVILTVLEMFRQWGDL